MERNMELDNEKIIDNDLEKLLAILHNIPEEKIPDKFERRLSEALKEEGKRIRQEKLLITARKKRNRYLKAAAVIAACFVVVFASLSVYNDDIGLFSWHNVSEEAPVGDIMLAAEDSDSTAEERASYGAAPGAGAEKAAESEDMELAADLRVMAERSAPAPSSRELPQESDGNSDNVDNAELYFGMQATEPDILCREGSQYKKTTEEYRNYLKLLDEYLSGYEYELTDCERDSDTGAYMFTVLILSDPEGQIVNVPLTLRGEQGVIYEQPEQQSTEGEPIEEQLEGNDAEEEEPQTGSD
ncbi:MAG TPA: hypothetical protein PLD22_03810 [Bacillota bacterium]|nr:hypothetical protein [Bacillota bacterium]HPZ59149.1 hypothetical protein [Bacillota bacterium]HQC82434.1 hypothetical protein [Bacillota bacterium]